LKMQVDCLKKSKVFVRVDDLGCHDLPEVDHIVSVCRRRKIPVILAIIPEKLGKETAEYLKTLCRTPESGLVLAQHGVSHVSQSGSGKKMEFSLWEPTESIVEKLKKGRDILERSLDSQIHWYVPPWNKYGRNLIRALESLRFKAFSGSTRLPFRSDHIVSFPINQDIVSDSHCRTIHTDPMAWVSESKRMIHEQGHCGLMLHHHWLEQQHIDALRIWAEEVSSFNVH